MFFACLADSVRRDWNSQGSCKAKTWCVPISLSNSYYCPASTKNQCNYLTAWSFHIVLLFGYVIWWSGWLWDRRVWKKIVVLFCFDGGGMLLSHLSNCIYDIIRYSTLVCSYSGPTGLAVRALCWNSLQGQWAGKLPHAVRVSSARSCDHCFQGIYSFLYFTYWADVLKLRLGLY